MVATSASQFFRVSMILLQEELFTGANKKFNVSRRLRDGSTGGYVQVTKTIECPIKPGYKAGTKMTFPDDGDEQPDGNALLAPCVAFLHPLSPASSLSSCTTLNSRTFEFIASSALTIVPQVPFKTFSS